MNREQWLNEVAKAIEGPIFKNFRLAKYTLTCGWPCTNALSKSRMRVGECHALESSNSKTHEIFISPILEKPIDVAGVITHEMAHVAAGIKAAHGKEFVRVCKHVGLTKGKATHASPGPLLVEKLEKIITIVGEYPHKALIPQPKLSKPGTSVGLTCVECGCRAVMSLKWISEAGLPTCGCSSVMEVTSNDKWVQQYRLR